MCQPAVDVFLQVSLVGLLGDCQLPAFLFLVTQLDEEKVFKEGRVSGVFRRQTQWGSARHGQLSLTLFFIG